MCNTDKNPELNITIEEFIEKITANPKHSNFFKEEILSNIDFPEDIVSIEDKVEYICKSHQELYTDYDEDYSEETLSYLERIDIAMSKLNKHNLTINSEINNSSYSLDILSPKYTKILKAKINLGLVFCYSQFEQLKV